MQFMSSTPLTEPESDGMGGFSSGHDQVLGNQSCGITCSVARSGPRLYDVIRTKMLSGSSSALAYYMRVGQFNICCRSTFTHLNEYIPIAVFVKRVRVQDFVLGHVSTSTLTLGYKLLVRKSSLGILVQELHIRMRRRRIEVVIQFLHVFAMIPLMARNAKQPLLQDRVLVVPK